MKRELILSAYCMVLPLAGACFDPGDGPALDASETDQEASGDETAGDAGVTEDGGSGSDDGPPLEPCTEANAPQQLLLEGQAFPRSGPHATWQAPVSGCAPTVGYEVGIGTAPGADDLVAYFPLPDEGTWDGSFDADALLPEGMTLHVSLRAIDAEGNVSNWESSPFEVWSPAMLPALSLWFDVSSPSTVFADASCSVPVAQGDTIACVLDRSGNGNHFAVVEGSAGPLYQHESIGGQPAADFSGARALFALDSATISPAGPGLTIALVDHPQSISDSAYYVLQKELEYQLAYFSSDLQVAVETEAPGLWVWSNAGSPTVPAPQLNLFVHDDTEWQFHRNGQSLAYQPAAGGQGGVVRDTTEPLLLGTRLSGGTVQDDYDGRLGEVVIVASALDASDRERLEEYLLQKWRLGGA